MQSDNFENENVIQQLTHFTDLFLHVMVTDTKENAPIGAHECSTTGIKQDKKKYDKYLPIDIYVFY